VLSNLRQAALYVNAAMGVSIRPESYSMTVQIVGELETVESIKRYFDQVETKIKKLGSQIKHAEAMGYSVSHVLQAAESATGMKLLVAS
jgi:predicted patatin/cPLA2 family phospholipase